MCEYTLKVNLSSNSIELDEDDVEIVEYYQLLLNQLLDAIRRIVSE